MISLYKIRYAMTALALLLLGFVPIISISTGDSRFAMIVGILAGLLICFASLNLPSE
jgi:hypothetical protein